MAQISIIRYSDIVEAKRFDAEYFKPEYLEIEEKLKKLNSVKLISKDRTITDGSHETRNYVKEGICFLRVQDIFENNINIKEKIYISNEENEKLKRSEPRKDRDILITKTGKVGVATVFNLDFRCNIPADIALLRNDSKLNSYYISTFINSRYGKYQFLRHITGLSRPRLVLNSFNYLKIPILPETFQKEIENIVKTAHKKIEESKKLYKEAEQILLNELGLLNHKPKHKLTFTASIKEIKEAKRFDAEYFQPKYKEIIEKIENYNIISLADKHYFEITTGTYLNSYSDIGTPYIRSVDINDDLTINIENTYKTMEKVNTKFKVKTGDIITSRVGSIGTLGYVSEELNNSVISDNILRIRNYNKDINNLFLALYLKKIGTIFMERLSRGSVQQRLNQETLKEIKIPLIDQETQKIISQKIQESHKLRKESKELLKLAIKKVEEEIEKEADK